jgi:2-polyprenyl-6-methoxyphenol hydroxylase-like FAD-dependent oxidoreductase
MYETYDVVVVGARCAGAPTAMLLARQGHRVLLVDRADFPSDTLSTHVVHPPGVAALDRWGLLERVVGTGCPPMPRYSFDFGPLTLAGAPHPVAGHAAAYAPRRTVLDAILVDAARESGVEVREGFNVDEVLTDDGTVRGVRGHDGTGPAAFPSRLVIGADGRNGHVARAVSAEEYAVRPRAQYAYFTYFRDLPVEGLEVHFRPFRGFALAPTNDGATMAVAGWPYAEAGAFKADVEANFLATLRAVPEVADRLASAERVAPFLGGAVPGFLRVPFGPGWALVGDAGHTKDPITAMGITDAFLDAELCAMAVDAWLTGRSTYDDAMGAWHRKRDARVTPMYELTSQLATLEPPPPEMQQLFAAIAGHQDLVDDFVSVNAGVLSPAEFFSPESVEAMLGRAPAA